MDVFLGDIIVGLVCKLGLYIRFLFYKLIGKRKSIKYLKGNSNNLTKGDQTVSNGLAGCLTVIIILIPLIICTLIL
jgi:hypothetical protein